MRINMERMPVILGKDIPPEKLESLERKIAKKKERGAIPSRFELTKTHRFEKFFPVLDELLNGKLRGLGLEGSYVLDPKRVHLYSDEAYEGIFGRGHGKHNPSTGEISINVDIDPDFEKGDPAFSDAVFFKTLLHECLHDVSYEADHYSVRYDAHARQYRQGYLVRNPSDQHEHFRGLNEGIIDLIALDTIKENADRLAEKFPGVGKDAWLREDMPSYGPYVHMAKTIIKKIAAHNGESEDVVKTRFEKSLFTGDLLHLKDVERVYGKGALRVLAAIGSEQRTVDIEAIGQTIERYFESDSEGERDRLAYDILNERERFRYQNRRGER